MSGILLSIRTLAEYTRARSCNCTATTDGDSAKCSILKNGISTAQVSSCAWFHLGQGHTLFQLICQPIGLPIPRVVLTPARPPPLPWASAWLTRIAGPRSRFSSQPQSARATPWRWVSVSGWVWGFPYCSRSWFTATGSTAAARSRKTVPTHAAKVGLLKCKVTTPS
jgi:hypothetical protein